MSANWLGEFHSIKTDVHFDITAVIIVFFLFFCFLIIIICLFILLYCYQVIIVITFLTNKKMDKFALTDMLKKYPLN